MFGIKKILLLSCLLLLTNCATPTSALLGPIFTGAKTGSIYQASLSYSSNRLISELKNIEKKKNLVNTELKDFYLSTFDRNLNIMNSYEIAKVEFSNVLKKKPLR